jgi:hypothetical protein
MLENPPLINRLFCSSCFALVLLLACAAPACAEPNPDSDPSLSPFVLAGNWQVQDAAKAPQSGAQISAAGFNASGWLNATVPGTVLTTLVETHVYPEPLYGENNRPEKIPDNLARKSYWYRTVVEVPKSYKGHQIWLNFDGINYSAVVWVNGAQVGAVRGAFIRGIFDITARVKPGENAVVAVLVSPQPHPGVPHEHTLRAGIGPNGGISAIDGPTFLSTIGWDWIPAIRDRDTGIWQQVFLSATGRVLVKDPQVTTDLPLPSTDSADVTVRATVENVSGKAETGQLEGSIGNISFSRKLILVPHSSQVVTFDAKNTPALHIKHPRLWWPNGYGAQNLYHLHLDFKHHRVSDAQDLDFGVRKITYSVPGTDTLTISVNGVPVFIRGGDWGLDEAMKRIPRARLEAEIRMHQLAHLNMIRNWVGQSTGEDFYQLCDQYGILVWDEFFQPNPGDGPNPSDIHTYIANVRDKILRFRNHPSIAIWCARNEGYPPPQIDAPLRKLLAELDPTRRYQPSSTDGAGVRSHGPYFWRTPAEFYRVTDDYFKTETGSVSVPTLESIHGMMPQKDWNSINDDWAEHDFARGNSGAENYPAQIAARYGAFRNLPDFVRKAQMANYEAFRAMYEGRSALLFHPTTAVLTWMSNPAQPSFVWQLYHYDLEPMSSYFAVMHAAEMVHIQFNQATGHLQVIDNMPQPVKDATARVSIYNLDGSLAARHETSVTAAPETATDLGLVELPTALSAVHFLKLELVDSAGKLISGNFYWRAQPGQPESLPQPGKPASPTMQAPPIATVAAVTRPTVQVRPAATLQAPQEHRDDLTALNQMPMVALVARATSKNANGIRLFTVTLRNPTTNIALMAHLQLRRKSGERALPAYYSDNYVSLVPNETKIITIEAAADDLTGPNLKAEDALIVFDGWNVTVAPASFPGVSVAPNLDAQQDRWPATGLPYQTVGLR